MSGETSTPAPDPLTPSAGRFGASLRDRWLVVALAVLVLGSAGVAAGLAREPTYEAESQLSVGQASIATQSTAGYAQAVQNLAGVYSRIVRGDEVVRDTARALNQPAASLRGRLSADPVPESSVFRVTARATSAEQAIRVNRAATKAALDYIDTLSNSGEDAARESFDRYVSANRRANQRRAQANALPNTAANADEIADLRSKAAASDLIAEAAAQVYRDNRTPTTTEFKGAIVLTSATSATNDRDSWAARLAIAGIGAGLVTGAAVALLMGPRRRGSPAQ